MPHDARAWPLIRRIAAKETALFFASPIAYLFLAAFAAITLFVFFWGEAFFARNIADLRPLFEWMPVLLVFLASALTMRLWSDERRSGTLEHVLTQPVPLWQFVLGKFLACLGLLGVALLITLPLPLTVAVLGDLDWGPVLAGYLATFLLGGAYLSIGLFVSARSDNQIVSLISSVALCGFFYVLGSGTLTAFFGNEAGQWLRLLGTGSRFESITRGMIDFRDLYYYLSIMAVFLSLNTYVLERERWAASGQERHQRWRAVTLLLVANVVGANLWLGQISALRLDATEGRQYSISEATRGYLAQLQEPLLLRGYFSSKTHPLLAPLVPQLQDLMREYGIAGGGRVRVEIVDPLRAPEQEEEANQRFGIQPVPFQVADRYQASIVSSYFNVMVQYGDEYEVLGFDDLIEVRGEGPGGELNVQLRNPEHDLTRAIRSVLNSYQAGGNLFDTVRRPLTFTAYVSAPETLPEMLLDFRAAVERTLEQQQTAAAGRLTVNFVDPDAEGGALGREIAAQYGFQPLSTSLLSNERFWFHMLLSDGEQAFQIPLGDLSAEGFARDLDAAIKRFASGFTRTVAVVAPQAGSSFMGMGMGPSFNQLRTFLGAELNLQDEDLSDGVVSGEADLLLLLAPENLDEKALFAVDQFLMRGGTVLAATSPFQASLNGDTLAVQPVRSGLEDWLAHHGLTLGQSLVMDSRNAAFPVPVTRNVGGFMLREWRLLDYPYFIDLREAGLEREHPITARLPQLTVAWASPIELAEEAGQERQIVPLLRSSPESWLSSSLDVMPAVEADGSSAFRPSGERASQLLGVISSGRFQSYFAERESPLLSAPPETAEGDAGEEGGDTPDSAQLSSVIERSPESARLIVIASNDFLQDQVTALLGGAANGQYLNNLQFMANAVDWALDDSGLLSIRSRGNFNRTLPPMEAGQQRFWEYLNYALAGAALALLIVVQRRRAAAQRAEYARLVTE